MNGWNWVLAAALCSSTVAHAQNVVPADPCHGTPKNAAAAKHFFTFDQFDRELRTAISREDAVALAFLVKFPLRINDAGGTTSIDDAAALKTHFQEVFTSEVRKQILGDKLDNVGCNDEGLMYGPGAIWVDASERGYAITTVNRDATAPSGNPLNIAKINYICQTSTHRIVIDTLSGGVLRYRSWKRPRAVTDTPDLEIDQGDGSFEGTGLCAYPVYMFENGDVVYRVEGALGCYGDSDGPPKEATGRFEVKAASKKVSESWCY